MGLAGGEPYVPLDVILFSDKWGGCTDWQGFLVAMFEDVVLQSFWWRNIERQKESLEHFEVAKKDPKTVN